MKTNRIVPTVAGIFIFLSIIVTSVWFLSSSKSEGPKEIAIDKAIAKIENREIKEVRFKQSQAVLTDKSGEKYSAVIGSEPVREALLGTIKEYNKINTSAPIKYDEEPVLSGWGWIVFINSLPILMFFLMWAATLAVIVYAVRTLSRNKS